MVKIYYYKNNKFSGRYYSGSRNIVIYIYDDLELIELIDTVIHEYVHHLQFAKQNTQADYNKQLYEVGYWQISYELEARMKGKKNRNQSYKWILKEIKSRR